MRFGLLKEVKIKNVVICFTTLSSLVGAHLYYCNLCTSILRQQIPLKYRKARKKLRCVVYQKTASWIKVKGI